MPRKNSFFTYTDQFCGAGGNGQAINQVSKNNGGGHEVKLAMNHWKLATETYSTNFPNARVACADISASDPRRYPSTDFLITSPECTEHSYGNGKAKYSGQLTAFDEMTLDANAERSRATMWDVPRFAEYHEYNYIIVENVVPARKWRLFAAWLKAMRDLGYDHQCVYHNSMFSFPVPQSRDRMYVHFWKKGNKKPDLDYRPSAHCPECGKDVGAVQTWKKSDTKFGIYGDRGQYLYKCPVHAIRVYPYYYAAFNCIDWSNLGTRIGDRKKELAPNTIRRITHGREKLSNWPFYIQHEHSNNIQNVRLLCHPFPTQTTRQTLALVIPSKFENIQIPSGTIITTEQMNSFICCYNNGSHVVSSVSEPMNAVTTVTRHGIVHAVNNNIEDWYYRTIQAKEVKKAMAFGDDYRVLGTEKEQVVQYGNAVTPPAMAWQIERAIQTFN